MYLTGAEIQPKQQSLTYFLSSFCISGEPIPKSVVEKIQPEQVCCLGYFLIILVLYNNCMDSSSSLEVNSCIQLPYTICCTYKGWKVDMFTLTRMLDLLPEFYQAQCHQAIFNRTKPDVMCMCILAVQGW